MAGSGPSGEASSFSPGQENPHLWWNPKVYNRVLLSPSLIPVMSQINPVHALFISWRFRSIIILPSRTKSSKNLSSSGFPPNSVRTSILTNN